MDDGWRARAGSIAKHAQQHQLSLIGSGVAFFALLSIPPAMVAVVSVYGLVASPADVSRRIDEVSSTMPTEARQLVTDQLQQVVHSSSTSLGVALIVGILIALWSASSAIKQLLVALSAVYDVPESRTFVRLRARAAVLTLGAIIFAVITILALTVVPSWTADHIGDGARTAVSILRWPLLGLLMFGALGLLYHLGPDRHRDRWRWWSWGAVVAVGSWLVASALFSLYVSHFGSYNKTYGALAAVVVLMLWLYLTVLCVLFGGEIDAELDRRRTSHPATETS